tara:strand:+ start:1864 stop:1992 length:129 start_codon:yes stop_codon:yes gene_type:complete
LESALSAATRAIKLRKTLRSNDQTTAESEVQMTDAARGACFG